VSDAKQETVFANVLRGMNSTDWASLLKEIESNGYRVDDDKIREFAGISEKDNTSPQAIKNNLVPVVRRLHSFNSTLLESLAEHLKKGRIVIIDISLMSSGQGEELAGLILNRLFIQNQQSFTAGASGEVIPIISVIEEAQSVLSKDSTDTSPFVVWAKEGRKYQLGCILITQQPGSISRQLLSQGDNFFSFHLLSESDLRELQKVNAHFSDDILGAILNEPIKGNVYFWSAPDQPFVLGAKVEDFQKYVETKIKETQATVILTPTEEFSKNLPDLERRLDEFIKNAVLNRKQIKVYGNVSIDGANNSEVVAVKLWNLKYDIPKVIGTDLGRLFCERGPDYNQVIKDEVLFTSLKRQNLLFSEKVYRGQDAKYILLNKAPFRASNKTSDDTKLGLNY